jgi:uncharacterized RDD family membrane protein YckC
MRVPDTEEGVMEPSNATASEAREWAVAPSATPIMPTGVPLSSVGKRLGAYLLELVLMVVTLFIGWLVWSFVVWGKGQTPSKALLKMRAVKPATGRSLSWGQMFVREVLVKGLLVGLVLGTITFGIMNLVAPLLIFGGTMRQTLWDRIAKTVVVDDADDRALAY